MRYSFATLVCALVCFRIASAYDPDQRVSFDVRARTLKEVIVLLSQELRSPLFVHPSLEKEIMLIKVGDVRAEDLLTQIAQANHADWTRTDKGLLLNRSKESQESLTVSDQEKIANRIEALQKAVYSGDDRGYYLRAINSILDPKTRPIGLTADEEAFAINARDFFKLQGELVKDLMLGLDTSAIANLPDKGLMVVTLNPNQNQKPFDLERLKRIQSAQIKFATLCKNMKTIAARRSEQTQKPVDETLSWMMTEEFLPVSDLRVTVRKNNPFTYSVRIRQDGNSEFALSGFRYLQLGGTTFEDDMPEDLYPVGSRTLKLNQPKRLVKLDPLTKSILDLRTKEAGIKSVDGYDAIPMLITSIRQVLADPVKTDPLSLADSETLLALAEDQGGNLVANLPDQIWTLGSIEANFAQKSLDSSLKLLERKGMLDFSLTSGWLNVRSRYPSLTTLYRLDRIALKKAIEAEADGPGLNLKQQIQFANSYPDRSPEILGGLDEVLLPSLAPGFNVYQQATNYDYMRFLGSLTSAQLSILNTGQVLPYRTLSISQQAAFRICLLSFRDLERLKGLRSRADRYLDDFLDIETRKEVGNFSSSELGLRKSPFIDQTDAAHLLIKEAFFRLGMASEKVVFPIDTDLSEFSSRSFNVSGLATFLEIADSPALAKLDWGKIPPLSGPYYFGERQFADLSFSVAGFGTKHSLSESIFEKTPLKMEELPSDFLAELKRLRIPYKKAAEELAKAAEEMQEEDPVVP